MVAAISATVSIFSTNSPSPLSETRDYDTIETVALMAAAIGAAVPVKQATVAAKVMCAIAKKVTNGRWAGEWWTEGRKPRSDGRLVRKVSRDPVLDSLLDLPSR
jgi:hypothetical protein